MKINNKREKKLKSPARPTSKKKPNIKRSDLIAKSKQLTAKKAKAKTIEQIIQIAAEKAVKFHKNMSRSVEKKVQMPTLSELEKMYDENNETIPQFTDTDSGEAKIRNTTNIRNDEVLDLPTDTNNDNNGNATNNKEIISHEIIPPSPICVKTSISAGKPSCSTTINIHTKDECEVPSTSTPMKNTNIPPKWKHTKEKISNNTCNDVIVIGDVVCIDDEPLAIQVTKRNKKQENKVNWSINDAIIFIDDHEIPSKKRKLSEDEKDIITPNNKDQTKGSDSDSTIIYNVNSPSNRFSPLPSTSTDNVTILKNDEIFNNSISKDGTNTVDSLSDDDVIILPNEPPEIIYIDDSISSNMEQADKENVIQASNPSQRLVSNNSNSNELPSIDVIPMRIDGIIAESTSLFYKYTTLQKVHHVIEVSPEVISPMDTSNTCQTPNMSHLKEKEINKTAPKKTKNKNNTPEGSPTSNGRNCPICFEKIYSKPCASTICGHIFCMPCIASAVLYSKRCPTCRKKLTGKGYHQLFL